MDDQLVISKSRVRYVSFFTVESWRSFVDEIDGERGERVERRVVTMAFLFQKFQEAVKTVAKNPMFARDPRHLQFEADINRLFLYTSYNRLGRNADENDIEEIIDIASKASITDQQKQVQENVHSQMRNLCQTMDSILQPNHKIHDAVSKTENIRPSGLSWAVGRSMPSSNQPAIPETMPCTRMELSQNLKDSVGYTLEVKPSHIPCEEAGQGLFLCGEADVGSVVGIYPGIIYSPAYYRNIPGYPRVDASNSYLITRYDGMIINAQPWGIGGETREPWDGFSQLKQIPEFPKNIDRGADRLWRMLSKPSDTIIWSNANEILERRNPLAFAHFANHPSKGPKPNVMVCPYDFPVSENDMRAYIPNIGFGPDENVRMKRFGNFWFKSGSLNDGEDSPVVKTLLLVATGDLSDEEILLNYRLSNSKKRPTWYTPVDEEEDRRRWS